MLLDEKRLFSEAESAIKNKINRFAKIIIK